MMQLAPQVKRVATMRRATSPDRATFVSAICTQGARSSRPISELCKLHTVIKALSTDNQLTLILVKHVTFDCDFYEIPEQIDDITNTPFDLKNLPRHSGKLIFDAVSKAELVGSFKTGHQGSIVLDHGLGLPPFTGTLICVKQPYVKNSNGSIRRMESIESVSRLEIECRCLYWAVYLMQLTYRFIHKVITQWKEVPSFVIPKIDFVRGMLAITKTEPKKAFLVEQWLDTSNTSTCQFTKYIHNGKAMSCLSSNATDEEKIIAEFLTFAQHFQWHKTRYTIFTSDF
jgi:hypothetical protein